MWLQLVVKPLPLKCYSTFNISVCHHVGDDCHVIIWDCHTGEGLYCLHVEQHGPVIWLLWLWTSGSGEKSTNLFGCADGTIHHYHHQQPVCPNNIKFLNPLHKFQKLLTRVAVYADRPQAIQSMAYHGCQVATTAGQSVCMWKMQHCGKCDMQVPSVPFYSDWLGSLKLLWRYKHDKCSVAHAAHFLNAVQQLLILFLESHEAYASPWLCIHIKSTIL